MDIQSSLHEILQRLKNIEERVTVIEKQNRYGPHRNQSPHIDREKKSNKFHEKFAEDVNSIVGLQEALTWKHKPIKIIWIILLCLGTIGTVYYIYKTTAEYLEDPTATAIKLENKNGYSFPPLIICPPSWLDADKAISMGLSVEALQYSLGFFEGWGSKFENISKGKSEFYKFYHQQNFSSLGDYFKAIATDIVAVNSSEDLENSSISSSYCNGCNEYVNGQKIFKSFGVCYVYLFEPLDSKGRGWTSSSTTKSIEIKVTSLAKGLIQEGNYYQTYFEPDLHVVKVPVLALPLQAFHFYMIKLASQNIIALHSDDVPCNKKASDDQSAAICMGRCMNEHANQIFGCTFLPWSTGIIGQPSDYCNLLTSFQNHSLVNATMFEDALNYVEKFNTTFDCYGKCPYSCDRMIYDTSYIFHGPINENLYAIVNESKRMNMTYIQIFFSNTALYQGGLLTIREYNTFSFSTLIGNVGGTLGLFTGCTVLTLAQIFLSLVSYFLHGKNDVREMA